MPCPPLAPSRFVLALGAAALFAPASLAQTTSEPTTPTTAETPVAPATTLDSAATAAAAEAEATRARAAADSLAEVARNRRHAAELATEGVELLRAGNFTVALEKFDAGLALNSESLDLTYGRAAALAQLGRNEEAVPAFERAIALAQEAGNIEALTLAQQSLTNVRQAVAATQQAAAAQAAAAAYTRVDSLFNAASPLTKELADQAIPILASVEGQVPADLGFHYRYARALNAAERYAAAAGHAEQAVQMSTGEADRSAYYYELGLALKGMNQMGQAREAFEQARAGTWSGWADYQPALAFEAAGLPLS